jgi:hypothetical protein
MQSCPRKSEKAGSKRGMNDCKYLHGKKNSHTRGFDLIQYSILWGKSKDKKIIIRQYKKRRVHVQLVYSI